MKGKYRILILTTFAVLALSLASPAHAAGSPTFYLRTDKPAYVPGDTGSLVITIRNEGDQAFTVKNMTISYPWLSYLNDHWDGNVTINNILPGAFDTDRLRSVLSKTAEQKGVSADQAAAARAATIPARRFGQPDEFGAACAFLCSSHAGYITGQNLLIDGGVFNGAF